MSILIRHGKADDDHEQWIEGDLPQVVERLEAGEHLVLPLAVWLAHRARLDPLSPLRAGVWLGPEDTPEAVLPWLAGIPLVAIHFPVFTDGRGYSLAHLLRRHGYAGELRAAGDVLVDQIALMAQCGFDSFCLRADQSPAAALAALAGGPRSPWPGPVVP